MTRKREIIQMSAAQFAARFPDEEACYEYLTSLRWPHGVRCPRCRSRARKVVTMPGYWQCYQCSPRRGGYRFSARVGTIFENSKYPLLNWFQAMRLIGMSNGTAPATMIQKEIGAGSYRTALEMRRLICAGQRNAEPFMPLDRKNVRRRGSATELIDHDESRH